jgi:hypothetical protein
MSERLSKTIIYILVIGALLISSKPILAQSNIQAFNKESRITELLSIIREPQIQDREPARLIKAIEELGDLKAIKAIDDLIQLLNLKREIKPATVQLDGIEIVDLDHPIVDSDLYPAVIALYHIGKPALPALVNVIKNTENDSLNYSNALCALKYIFRDDTKQGATYLRNLALQASSEEAARRLINAAEQLE